MSATEFVINGGIVKHVRGNQFHANVRHVLEWLGKATNNRAYLPKELRLVSDRTGEIRDFEYAGITYDKDGIIYIYKHDNLILAMNE